MPDILNTLLHNLRRIESLKYIDFSAEMRFNWSRLEVKKIRLIQFKSTLEAYSNMKKTSDQMKTVFRWAKFLIIFFIKKKNRFF